MITLKNILVATDFGEAADAALVYGRELSSRFGATLHLLHVAETVYVTTFSAETYAANAPNLQRELEDTTRARLDELAISDRISGPPAKPAIVTSSSPASAIIDYAGENGADLIVMGIHGRSALAHLLMGSVAEKVVRLAPCPVLTVRHPESEFVRQDALAEVAIADVTDTADTAFRA
jgi:nucleotide-binding universal stress UspA family protein